MMRVAILGSGPAGLYLAYLLKRRRPDWTIDVYEQNAADTTFGFGLAFSERALHFLKSADSETYETLAPALETWNDSIIVLNGETIRIDGIGYAGIGRLRLLAILQARAASVGVVPLYGRRIESLDELGDADLIVGADGINSVVRRARDFGTRIGYFTNRFAWYGTPKRFDALSHTFIATEYGAFNAHHHRHAPDMSTFVVETDAATFLRCGFDTMPPAEAQAFCARTFADTLDGAPLISNNSIWRQFPRITNARWWSGNCVLLGDALHTAHFSIGSGTRLAMEDAIALAAALAEQPHDLAAALSAYEAARRSIVTKLVAAANASAEWYEHFADHMRLSPLDFAYSYITRSGRVDLERLRATSPDFVAAYEARGSTRRGSPG
jgi:2-polyprenyl-6-methoxyphenol hydroxylase-like FAD-dependent oxidoreductase